MRKYSGLLLLAFLVTNSLLVRAQTKLIAHKSHSGSNESFQVAYETGFFDMGNSNFGVAPERNIRTASLDSLILVSDSVAVMVTSEYCQRQFSRKPVASTKWRAGRDTVFNHPLFSKKHSVAYIKNYLSQYYYFQNPVDSIKIIVEGDEQQQQQQQHEYQSIPAVGSADGNDHDGNGNNPVMWLSLMAILSLFVGAAYHWKSKFQKTA